MNAGQEKKARILLVEDEQIVALDITRTLSQLGYHVLPAVDTGEAAIACLEREQPDLILLDIKIKGEKDGIETAKEIKRRFPVPFIFLSTFSDNETLSRAKRTAPYGYITKSSHRNDLHSMIEMALYRHQMELEAQKNEEFLAVTLKSISDAVIGASLDGMILSWNSGAEQIFGYREMEVSGKNLSLLTPPFYPNELPDILEKIQKGIEVEHYETVRQHKNGQIINVSLKINPIRGEMGEVNGVSLIARDITAKKQLERQILEISERERQRIGKDLHDSLGQNLTAISLQLKILEGTIQEHELPDADDIIKRIEGMVSASIKQTRNLAKNLLTVTLQNQGLSVALNELASHCESLYSVKTRCKTSIKNDIIDEVIANQLYHIAQEAMTNANRHGKAETIEIELAENDSEYILKIHDDGKGHIEEIDHSGLGLKIMEYRSNMINGRLSIFDERGRGTTVSCRVPKYQ